MSLFLAISVYGLNFHTMNYTSRCVESSKELRSMEHISKPPLVDFDWQRAKVEVIDRFQ
jgi:hypothetical protein